MDEKLPQKGYISLLMLACQQGNIHQIQELLVTPQSGDNSVSSSVLQVDQTGRSALHYCAEYSRFDCAEFLVSNIPDEEVKKLVDIADHEGFTALLIAVINGNIQLLGLLIGKGASVDAQDKELHTPVHWATVCGHYNCLDLLLDHKAEASSPDIHGAYPIHYAAQMSTTSSGGSAAVTRPNTDISTTPSPNTSQRNPTPNQGFRFLQRLISYGVPVSPLDLDRRQPLLWAASSGAHDACGLLVKSGSDPELGDKDGLTALHCAASRGHLECVKVLIEDCSAYVDAKDKHDCTPLMYAATLGYIDCIRYLNSMGADKNHQDRKGRSAAHLAASKGQTESIMELEDLGGNIWLRNLRGDFPLHEAAQAGYIGVLEFLLSRKPDAIGSTNNDGRSCLHIAAMQKDFALCQFLVENKINVNLVMHNTKRQYFTAVDLASAKNNIEMSRYLRANGGQEAVTVTGKAVTRIQKTFLQFSKEKNAGEVHLDPNGILEEAFETGAEMSSTGMRRASVRSGNAINGGGDELEDELVMLETDSSYLPRLPHEVSSSPTDIGTHVAKERHSDYDEIMDKSVLGGSESTFNPSHGFAALPSNGGSKPSHGPLFSIQQTAEEDYSSARSSPQGTAVNKTVQQQKSPLLRAESRRQITQPSPNTPVLKFFATEPNGTDDERTKTPPPGLISRTATPVFEMSSLALNVGSDSQSKNGSHNSLVKYDTDSGSDDDMKHPQHRSRFMRQLMSQNDMSYASTGPGNKASSRNMSFSRSYNSFLLDSTHHNHRPMLSARTAQPPPNEGEVFPPSLSARELNRQYESTPEEISRIASPPEETAEKTMPQEEMTEKPPPEEPIESLPTEPVLPSKSTSQATQMTPRIVRPVASRDSASSPRSSLTRELETQTDLHMPAIEENSDVGDVLTGSALSSRLSSSPAGPLSDKSDFGRQTSSSSARESSTVAVQTNGPTFAETGVDAVNLSSMTDSAVSARAASVADFDTQTTARGLTLAELTGGTSSGLNGQAQAIPKQLSETEAQTTPRKINMIPERRALSISTQESQTTPRGGALQPKSWQPSGLFTGDNREHKNSSSGDLGKLSTSTPPLPEDDTLPDTFVPPVLIERRKSRLRWDETAGIMPDATMLKNSTRRASFQAEHVISSKAEHISFNLPSLSGTSRGDAARFHTSTSVHEESENEAEEEDKIEKLKDETTAKDEKEDEPEEHHTEMYKKFRPPTPRVHSLKELTHPVAVQDLSHYYRVKKEVKRLATKKPQPDPPEKGRSRGDVSAGQNQFDQVALKNLTSTMRRFSTAMNLPSKTNGLPAMPAKFISSFNNTMLDLAPRSVIVKYLDQLDQMTKKGTRYNEPVVLSRLIPKYVKEMESTGKPDPATREKRNLLTEIRNFAEWGRYLIEQLTNAVAPLNDLIAEGTSSAETKNRVGSSSSKNGSDNLPDIDQSSNSGSVSTKGSPALIHSPLGLRPKSRNTDSMEALNGSPMISRVPRNIKSSSSKIVQSTNDKDTDNKLPALSAVPLVRHPFPWR